MPTFGDCPASTKAAGRWEKGSRQVRPTLRFRHACSPELPPGEFSALVFRDDMTVYWNAKTLRDLKLLDHLGAWVCEVAIFDGELFVEAPYCESQCDPEGAAKLRRLAALMIERTAKETPPCPDHPRP